MFIHHWQLLIIGLKGSSLCIDFGAFALATKIIASNTSLMEAYYHSKKRLSYHPRSKVSQCEAMLVVNRNDLCSERYCEQTLWSCLKDSCLLYSQNSELFYSKGFKYMCPVYVRVKYGFYKSFELFILLMTSFFSLFFCDIRGQQCINGYRYGGVHISVTLYEKPYK